MFASLKNKIKEETGNDPTRVTSSGFKERPSPSHGLLSDGPLEDSCNMLPSVGLGSANHLSGLKKLEEHHSLSNGDRSKYESEKNEIKLPDSESVDRPRPISSENLGLVVGLPENESVRSEVRLDLEQAAKNVKSGSTAMLAAVPEVKEELNSVRNSVVNELTQAALLEDFRIKEVARIKQVAAAETKLRHMEEQLLEARNQISESNNRCSRLTQALTGEKNANALLTQEASCLRNELLEQSGQVGRLGSRLEKEVREKDVMLLRNAQLNQDLEMARQSLRSQEQESLDYQSRLMVLENTLLAKEKEFQRQQSENEELSRRIKELDSITSNQNAASILENELRKRVTALEEQLAEKNKSIRVLQQHLGDLKKTLQRELKQNGDDSASAEGGAATTTQYTPAPGEPDVNFKYLKHVIMKFLTSREYEAQHLTRAVSTLLRFSPEEERLLRETLDWKMSWFGTRPSLGFGQTSKTIPPS